MANILMPTINSQTPSLKESEFKKYLESEEFEAIYDNEPKAPADSAPTAEILRTSTKFLKKN